MLVNPVANPTNVLQMNREHGTYVTYLYNTFAGISICLISASLCPMSLFPFKVVLIVHIRPEFNGNVNTNASESLQTSYDNYKCLVNNKMACDWLQICCE